VRFFNGDDAESLEQKGEQLLAVVVEAYDPSAEIIALEEPFIIELGPDVPPLHGFIDRIDRSSEGKTTIVDTKPSDTVRFWTNVSSFRQPSSRVPLVV